MCATIKSKLATIRGLVLLARVYVKTTPTESGTK